MKIKLREKGGFLNAEKYIFFLCNKGMSAIFQIDIDYDKEYYLFVRKNNPKNRSFKKIIITESSGAYLVNDEWFLSSFAQTFINQYLPFKNKLTLWVKLV